MFCAYHINTAALVHCSSCSRGLCSACDHRIKGFPYCQDCIVAGIQSLQRGSSTFHSYQDRPLRSSKGRAVVAALCALIPGAGAVYNRQNLKAICQFVGIIGLFRIASIRPLQFLGLAGFLFYFQSILDSYRTARAIAEGESAAANEERFKQALIKRAPVIGVGLILAGLLVFIRMVQPLTTFLSFSRLAPVILILFGGYLLTRYFKQSREGKPETAERSHYQFLADKFPDRTTRRAGDSSRFGK